MPTEPASAATTVSGSIALPSGGPSVIGRRLPQVPASQLDPTRTSERVFDVAVVLLLLPVILVVGVFVAIAIKLDSPGSVFFRSTRVGVGGREFQMLKFRKMRRSARGGPLTLCDDDRFTPIGQFLALTKLDELPQVWNVLRGEMRLVGPRPEVPEFVAQFPEQYEGILTVFPGITGPAAVAYATESKLLGRQADPLAYYEEQILPHKLTIDLEYVRDRSLAGDVLLLAGTAATPVVRLVRQARLRASSGIPAWHLGWVTAAVALVVVFLATNVSSY